MTRLLNVRKMLKNLQDDEDFRDYDGQADFIFMKEVTKYYYSDVRNFVLETDTNISQETKNIFLRSSQTLNLDTDLLVALKEYHFALKDILKNISATDFVEKTFK